MIASEVMMVSPVIFDPLTLVEDAMQLAVQTDLDVIPVVDDTGHYVGTVRKAALIDYSEDTSARVSTLCCSDALTCSPEFAVEHFNHDATSAVPHQTIVVVDGEQRYFGVIPQVHWAVDEAKVQSGHPRNPLEVRTYAMHLIYRCLNCGELLTRNAGMPEKCPACGASAEEIALYTED